MDVEIFGQGLTQLTIDDVRSIAHDLHAALSSPADAVANTRAVLIIEQTLRRSHRLHDGAAAALAAATKVQSIAMQADVDLPNDDVTCVARAAAQLARGMVVGDHPSVDDALHVLGRGWHRLACLAEFQAA